MKEVLTLDNAAHPHNRARLHAEGCPMLRAFNGKNAKKIVVVSEGDTLENIVAELEEMGYPVKRCKCLGKP